LTDEGLRYVLAGASSDDLILALREALREATNRSPLARALMQSDVWAAHDILLRDQGLTRDLSDPVWQRRDMIVGLLAEFVKKLALSPSQIRRLRNYYNAGRLRLGLPNLWSELAAGSRSDGCGVKPVMDETDKL
jgi:hypothetical protein